ncbi:MAG TPA: hypothetical protein VML55_12575 [Planctomycetaceae bacterium]|nr:hypothetical protein [Planctomycetaceae bacterium]
MTIERIREMLGLRPFQPFVMHLADGRAIRVQHQEFAALSPTGRTMVVYQPDDSMNIIDLLLVTDLEVRRNGQSKSKAAGRKRK